MNTFEEWAKLAMKTFPYGAEIIPVEGHTQYPGISPSVYEDADGVMFLRLWPNSYKDLNFVLNDKVVVDDQGWHLNGPDGETLLRPLQNKTEIF